MFTIHQNNANISHSIFKTTGGVLNVLTCKKQFSLSSSHSHCPHNLVWKVRKYTRAEGCSRREESSTLSLLFMCVETHVGSHPVILSKCSYSNAFHFKTECINSSFFHLNNIYHFFQNQIDKYT